MSSPTDGALEERIASILAETARGNCFGEEVTLVAATKMRSAEEVRRAIAAGISDVGENRVQEYRLKYDAFAGARRHFIGHLQTNKVRYLVGRCDLIQSVDRDGLAEEISRQAAALGVPQNVLVQINIGREATKGGYPLEEGLSAYERLCGLPFLRPCGLMAMLPRSSDKELLGGLADRMRALFDEVKDRFGARLLSMGMSEDWRLCLGHGANMIRLGTAIFGERSWA